MQIIDFFVIYLFITLIVLTVLYFVKKYIDNLVHKMKVNSIEILTKNINSVFGEELKNLNEINIHLDKQINSLREDNMSLEEQINSLRHKVDNLRGITIKDNTEEDKRESESEAQLVLKEWLLGGEE